MATFFYDSGMGRSFFAESSLCLRSVLAYRLLSLWVLKI